MLSHLVDLAWGSLMGCAAASWIAPWPTRKAALAVAKSVDAGWVRIWLVGLSGRCAA